MFFKKTSELSPEEKEMKEKSLEQNSILGNKFLDIKICKAIIELGDLGVDFEKIKLCDIEEIEAIIKELNDIIRMKKIIKGELLLSPCFNQPDIGKRRDRLLNVINNLKQTEKQT